MSSDKKIKVLHYITSLNDGGAETLVRNYAMLADREHFDVKIMVLRLYGDSANLNTLKRNNIPFTIVFRRWTRIHTWLNRHFHDSFTALGILGTLLRERPDVLHCHLEVLSSLIPIKKLLGKVRLFYTCHSEPERFLGQARPGERRAAEWLIRHNGLKIIALHDDMAERINDMFGIHDTIVIRNGIDMELYRKAAQYRTQTRDSLGIAQDSFVVGHVGRFNDIKNHAFLLDVFDKVHRLRDDAHLLLVGAGENEGRIRSRISELGLDRCVTIVSHRSDIPELLSAMDVFVFPSLLEGFGIALLEAQAAGLRCVASDTINRSVFISDRAVTMSLNDSPSEWAAKVLDDSATGQAYASPDDYDLSNEIRRLEALYLL